MARSLMILLLLVTQVQATGFEASSQVNIDQAPLAADFSLKSLDGRLVSLKDFRGKVVLLNFWATWCPPCRAEIPQLVRLQKERRRGLRIVGVTYPPTNLAKVRATVKRLGVNYRVLIGTRKVFSLYAVASVLPVSIIIDREGRIVKRIDGVVNPREIELVIP